MNSPLDRASAEIYAQWFHALADPTRILILNLLATEARPMKVGEIVDRIDVGQSTVSAHLRRLADLEWVLVEREGTSSWYRVNERCLTLFPAAADIVMGRVPTGDDQLKPVRRLPWGGRV